MLDRPNTCALPSHDTDALSGRLVHSSDSPSQRVPSGFLGALRGAVVVQSPFLTPKRASGLEPIKKAPERLSQLRGLVDVS